MNPAELNNDALDYCYTRAQRLEDGVLVEVTDWSHPIGFVVPVAISADLESLLRSKGGDASEVYTRRLNGVFRMLKETIENDHFEPAPKRYISGLVASRLVVIKAQTNRDEDEQPWLTLSLLNTY